MAVVGTNFTFAEGEAKHDVTKGRIARASTYLEMVLYDAAQTTAEREGMTISAWLRRLVVVYLIADGKLSKEQLTHLVVKD